MGTNELAIVREAFNKQKKLVERLAITMGTHGKVDCNTPLYEQTVEAISDLDEALSALSAYEERMGSEELVEKVCNILILDDYNSMEEYYLETAQDDYGLYKGIAERLINAIRGVGDETN